MGGLKHSYKLLYCLWALPRSFGQNTNAVLSNPIEFNGTDGVLAVDWQLQTNTVTVPNSNLQLTTRLFNGQYPGPTLRLRPGDDLRIHFTNELTDQGVPYVHNQLSAPDETNLHFHGFHVSGELPSDDTTLVVGPGESFNYQTKLPNNHMGGTHWMHPHRHGATSLQLGGGAFSALIVEDEPGTLPSSIENAREVLFLAHQLHIGEMNEVAEESSDGVWSATGATDPNNVIVTVNGQMQPVIEAQAGEWMRFRVLWAAWLEGRLDLEVSDGCEMQLLAKDGIYIPDVPRPISTARIVPGGRADLLVRCSSTSTTYTIQGAGQTVATIQTQATAVEELVDLESWTPSYPEYLTDLRTTSATSGCACETTLGGNAVNGQQFEDDTYLHESYLGVVVQRTLNVGSHPYHQHVYGFQLVAGFSDGTGYNQVGDWHDTIEGNGVIRYAPNVFTGKIMVHCHRLQHEDEGMMTMEWIHPANNTDSTPYACICGDNPNEGLSTIGIALICVAGVVVIAIIAWLIKCASAK